MLHDFTHGFILILTTDCFLAREFDPFIIILQLLQWYLLQRCRYVFCLGRVLHPVSIPCGTGYIRHGADMCSGKTS